MSKVLRSSEIGYSLSNHTALHLSTDCHENLKSRMPFSCLLHSACKALEHGSHGSNPTRGRYMQGRIKLFGAPRQWKHFRPLFQAVFLSWGGLPTRQSNTTPPSPKTEITNILFYILNLLRRIYCSGLRGCDTREKEIVIWPCWCFHGRYYFYSLKVYSYVYKRKKTKFKYLFN